ncbi:aa3-type cytochrome c oxidase subunit IV [Pseudohoeflea coraliihabitans]|uniref:Aa3-type cytochrome c oxidase subunit IV n=1 Tax=Pseudohoeflea coraliihabitans TaxID=2860393 RepID=A0ABS6WKQ1_9HYPH|nr:aa3-type cytochrome c oxidase subunit IV [Pseudohoeflea sp. DP4N28-3]MBW3096365.1 aa3-type cytochrome c oxidase subunit IV [Pseudohoeflea sp. DP4N28-3]
MAEHVEGPVESGAQMDYHEHEKTYAGFLAATKYGTLHLVTLMIAMAVFFFTGAGFFSSLILLIILSAIGVYLLR